MNWNKDEKEILDKDRKLIEEQPANWIYENIQNSGSSNDYDYGSILKISLALCLIKNWPILVDYKKKDLTIELSLMVEGKLLKNVYYVELNDTVSKFEDIFTEVDKDLFSFLGISKETSSKIRKLFRLVGKKR